MINQQGISHQHEERRVSGLHTPMRFREMVADICSSFGHRSFITGDIGEAEDVMISIIPVGDRGRGQVFCLMAQVRCWYYTASTWGYCCHCPFYQTETCLSDQGMTQTCMKGFVRIEAN